MKSIDQSQRENVESLVALLQIELEEFQGLINAFSEIDSSFKGDFLFMKSQLKVQKSYSQVDDLENNTYILIKMMEHLSGVFNKIVQHDSFSLYTNTGLLEKLTNFQKRMIEKYSI